MRTVTWRADVDGLSVRQLRVVEETPEWCHHERVTAPRLTLVHHGVFGWRSGRWRGTADPVTAYPGQVGQEQSISHSPGSVDGYTVIAVEGRTAARVRTVAGPLRTPARVDLARRVLAARVRQGADAFEIAERVHTLLGQLLDAAGAAPPSEGSSASHRRLADAARRLLAARPQIGSLTELAGELGTSRAHLSRVFRRQTGESLTRWRTRMRMQAAMDQLAEDGADLGRLAAGLGFADHAHLTRTTRRELGTTPSLLRTLLGRNGAV